MAIKIEQVQAEAIRQILLSAKNGIINIENIDMALKMLEEKPEQTPTFPSIAVHCIGPAMSIEEENTDDILYS